MEAEPETWIWVALGDNPRGAVEGVRITQGREEGQFRDSEKSGYLWDL